ncbi:FAD-dependent oxidoreductase [Maribellus sp. CM-23]|uniref:FAD-dependent oxidoreductase n=1 Tax=Maribellus sp. CM-23 TaxID=2781026 RepID=UPI001F17A6BA|nr:FAD-dependent oxidoreductase [Maribellus sp. CM-23]MCE4563489.1 FAD-dependent oxidoreductase [Maribellus sp. CM-23]
MKTLTTLIITLILSQTLWAKSKETIFVEAESFSNTGGWVIDQQFINEMGSPYLMAHGMGIPVKDAETIVKFPKTGKYYLFVRTKDWAAQWSDAEAPGRFQVLINGKPVNKTFGTEKNDWDWIKGGEVEITQKETSIALHDLSGFNGRCDALIFSADPEFNPVNELNALTAYRHKMLGIPDKPKNAGTYDFVVVGGGMGGVCAAISAARLGVKVALIQNRPVLGGNNSSEVRVHLGARIKQDPWPNLGNLVNEIGPERGGNAQPKDYYEDDKKLKAVLAEKNITLFLNCNADGVEMEGNKIAAVTAQSIITGERFIFKAPLFADCTGDGTIGVLAGADFMQGRESRDVFGEPTAPEVSDNLTMGASVQWFSNKKEKPAPFPDIKWGIEMNEEKSHALTRGDWDWETGMGVDQTKDFERVRDYGMLVVFSNWSYIKNHSSVKDKFANEQLQWVAFIAGKRETRRLVGDYVLNENDLRNHTVYPDGTAPTTWTMDLHYPHPENAELFPDAPFRSIAKHIEIYPYPIPFRCLYSKNVDNLLMAGRHISVSHVALGTTRLMRTIGMMGEVIGMAASVCKKENTTPRGIYNNYFAQMEKLMDKGVGDTSLPNKQTYNLGGTLKK